MIDVRGIVKRLKVIDSIAYIPRVMSTNAVARRVADECLENDISLPSAIIVAGEQLAGKGRGDRAWHSPPRSGIYATTMHTRKVAEFGLIPLEVANLVAKFLRETFALDARIKWPNDILVDGKKIAGILIDARIRESEVFLLIGTGINVFKTSDPQLAGTATAIDDVSRGAGLELPAVITAFIEYVDATLSRPFDPAAILNDWRTLTVHQKGDLLNCRLADRTVSGTWEGIDDAGRALLLDGQQTVKISAGDLIAIK